MSKRAKNIKFHHYEVIKLLTNYKPESFNKITITSKTRSSIRFKFLKIE